MHAIDMHCDTISKIYDDRREGLFSELRSNNGQIDLLKLKKGNYLLQNFAAFVHTPSTDDPFRTAMEMITLFDEELAKNSDIAAPVRFFEDIEENQKAGKISAMLTIEEGAVLKGQKENLPKFFDSGVRMIALTWNYENEIGSPNVIYDKNGDASFSFRNQKGLTEFGIWTIQEMQRLGMIIDVSHLSDGGFWDIIQHTKKPFVASHSDAASVCGVCRNLTDDMIRALAEHGGVTGINYCYSFLTDAPASSDPAVSTISDMLRHIRQITNVGGVDVCGLGSDFDGIGNSVEFQDASGIGMLADALHKDGYTYDEIDKIFYKNVLRVYKDTLPSRSF